MKKIFIVTLLFIILLCGCQKNNNQKDVEVKSAYVSDICQELSYIYMPIDSSIISSIEYCLPDDGFYRINKYNVSYEKNDITILYLLLYEEYDESLDYSLDFPSVIININTKFNKISFYLKFMKNTKTNEKWLGFTKIIDNNEKIYPVCTYEAFLNIFKNASDMYYTFGKEYTDVYDNEYNYVTTLLDFDKIKFKETTVENVNFNDSSYILIGGYQYLIHLIDSKTFYISTKYQKYNPKEIVEDVEGKFPYFDMCGKYYRIVDDIDELFK